MNHKKKTFAISLMVGLVVLLGLSNLLPRATQSAKLTTGCHLTFQIVPSPNIENTNMRLFDVAVAGPNDIWAVGDYGLTGANWQSLIIHWDGSEWSIVPSPDIHELYAIKVIAYDDIWAAGNGFLHWDGISWQLVQDSNTIYDLAVFGPNDVWGIGNNGTHAWHWDGTVWQLIPTSLSSIYATFGGIDGSASNNIWAVGSEYLGSFGYVPIAIHWNGSEWQNAPAAGIFDVRLNDIKVFSPNDAFVVGTAEGPITKFTPLIARWNGGEWMEMQSPIRSFNSRLGGISAISSSDVYVSGSYQVVENSNYHLLLEHWDGSGWSAIAMPQAGQGDNYLAATASVSTEEIWGVGSTYENNLYQALIVRGGLPCYVPTATPTFTPTATPTPPANPPRLIVPQDSAVLSVDAVHFAWTKAKGAKEYQLEVKKGSTEGQVVVQVTTKARKYVAMNLTPFRGGYLWHVRACNFGGCGPWSPYWKFLIQK